MVEITVEYSHGGDNCWTAIKNAEDQQNTIQWPAI